jgi:hypothetical protein
MSITIKRQIKLMMQTTLINNIKENIRQYTVLKRFLFSNTVTGLRPNSIHCTMGDNSDFTVLEFLPSFANKRNIMHIKSVQTISI